MIEAVKNRTVDELEKIVGSDFVSINQADPDLALWTVNERLKEAKATGATALVTSCLWCENNFKDAVKEYGEEIKICDIAEIVRKAL